MNRKESEPRRSYPWLGNFDPVARTSMEEDPRSTRWCFRRFDGMWRSHTAFCIWQETHGSGPRGRMAGEWGATPGSSVGGGTTDQSSRAGTSLFRNVRSRGRSTTPSDFDVQCEVTLATVEKTLSCVAGAPDGYKGEVGTMRFSWTSCNISELSVRTTLWAGWHDERYR